MVVMKNWQPLVSGPEFWLRLEGSFPVLIVRTHGHAEKTRAIMFQPEIFIGELRSTVDRAAPRSIPVDEISTLDHKVLDLGDVWVSL